MTELERLRSAMLNAESDLQFAAEQSHRSREEFRALKHACVHYVRCVIAHKFGESIVSPLVGPVLQVLDALADEIGETR